VSGLSRERLAAIGAALDALDARAEELAACRSWQWALAMTWELAPAGIVWCVVDAERFVLAGGSAWRDVLGYDPVALAGTRWGDYLAAPEDVAASDAVVAENLATGTGVEGFSNRYRHATRGTVHRVSWRSSPWRDGRTVARGEVET